LKNLRREKFVKHLEKKQLFDEKMTELFVLLRNILLLFPKTSLSLEKKFNDQP